MTTREVLWIRAWICTCHWSGTVTPAPAISASSGSGDPPGQHLAVRAVVGKAVAALGRADDRSAGPHDLVGRRHPLDRLV